MKKNCLEVENQLKKFYTTIVTASLTTPAIVTVTALVTETRMYSVNTCEKKNIKWNRLLGITHPHPPKSEKKSVT